MKYNIFGIQFDTLIPVDDKFDEQNAESDNATYFSKEEFFHEDEISFHYRYCIEAVYCEGSIFYGLFLVPSPKDLNKETLKSVASYSGVDLEGVSYYDVFSYGCNILFGNHKEGTDTINAETIDKIASIFETIDSLRGFYLDKPQNRIGDTGWSNLEKFIK